MPKQPKIYFQWQNEALLKTIYPLRTLNLRNALEYYEEIDLWQQYKGKKIEDMRTEVETYHKEKASVIQQAQQDYESLLDYFFDYDPEQDAELIDKVDAAMLKKAKKPHTDFKDYYDYRVAADNKRRKITDPFQKSYFISQRLENLDKDRKDLDRQIFLQGRRIMAIETNPNHDPKKLEEENIILTKLQNALPLFERQREKLTKLISVFNQLEARRKDFIQRKEQGEKATKKANAELPALRSKITIHESKLKGLQDDVSRLRLQLEPATTENYFADPDALTEMAHRFPKAEPAFCERVDAIREALAILDSRKLIQERLQEELTALQAERDQYRRRSRSKFKEQTLTAYEEVLGKMEEYLSILKDGQKTFAPLEKAVKEKEREIGPLQDVLRGLVEKVNEFLKQIAAAAALPMDVNEYVQKYQPVPPTMKDIINMKLDKYREWLKKDDKGQERDQYFLLGLLIERFKREPERFPRWLQYMIVHFSGMRYASAHGSWADPNDLYRTLQIFLIKNNSLDDGAVEEFCLQKGAAYTENAVLKAARASGDTGKKVDKFWKKIDEHLARIGTDDPRDRRQGLLNLLLDEELYSIETMSDHEALDALENLRDKKLIPAWMWKEISALTDLRLETKDKDWEKLTAEEQKKKNAPESAKYREIVIDWKEKYLTGWREEHEVNIQNVVSRAVCNEVAEYILHVRGLEGASGLSSLADMYTKRGIRSQGSPGQAEAEQDAPYFVRSKKAENFRPGAGILWLKYRNDPPPQWNLVSPFNSAGDKTLPESYINGGRWNYKDKDGLVRWRPGPNGKGKTYQYLFWVHVATVAEVARLGEEEVVLTFETSLPYEDRRMACVGVFKRAVHNLTFDGTEDMYNASFVGYVPDGPTELFKKDLDVMLNWKHVLLK